MKKTLMILCAACLLLLNYTFSAQEGAVGISVPDLKGMTLPQAAAVLNRNQLRVGEQTYARWMQSSGQPVNSISAQSPAAGSSAMPGDPIDLTIFRENNTVLIYDSNDLTIWNRSDEDIRIRETVFRSVDGSTSTLFAASRWRISQLLDGRCFQLWSISRDGPKPVPECATILREGFLTTTNRNEHFWTGDNGATQFEVIQDGVYRATCAIQVDEANRGTENEQAQYCEFYLAPNLAAGDVIEFVYLSYTSDQLLVINPSSAHWLPTSQVSLVGGLTLGDVALFDDDPARLGDVGLLAPGQCLRYLREGVNPATALPQSCDVVGEASFVDRDVFWVRDFNIANRLIENTRFCLAALPDETMLCLLPR